MSRLVHVLLVGVGLCLLAAAFAVPSLYVPGVGVALVAVAAFVSVRLAAAGADVGLELARSSAEEGTLVDVTIRVGGWGILIGEAAVQMLPGGPWSRLPFRGGSAPLRLRPQRRGRLAVGPAGVRFGDPFGICVAERRSPVRELLVLPRIERVPRAPLAQLLAGDVCGRPDDGLGVDSLRAYRPGAPASRIHWLTVARTGALVERGAEEGIAGRAVLIVLDASAPCSETALDDAVRAAASLCVALAGAGGCSLLLPGSPHPVAVRPDLQTWPALHTALATVRAGEGAVWRGRSPASLVVWVGAREPSAAERRGASWIVTPVAAAGMPTLFEVGGCAVQPGRLTQAVTR